MQRANRTVKAQRTSRTLWAHRKGLGSSWAYRWLNRTIVLRELWWTRVLARMNWRGTLPNRVEGINLQIVFWIQLGNQIYCSIFVKPFLYLLQLRQVPEAGLQTQLMVSKLPQYTVPEKCIIIDLLLTKVTALTGLGLRGLADINFSLKNARLWKIGLPPGNINESDW